MSETKYEVKCQYIITSKELKSEDISSMVGITPTHHFNKGDEYIITHPFYKTEEISKRPETQWSVTSETTIKPYINLNTHLEFFKTIFLSKIEKINQIRKNYNCETTLWIWISVNNPISLINFTTEELLFIKNLSENFVIQTKLIQT